MAKEEYQLGSARTENKGPGAGGRMMRVAEKPKNFWSAALRLIKYMAKYKLPLIVAMLSAFASVMLQLLGPDNLKKITDLIEDGMKSGNMDLKAITGLSIKVLLFYLGSGLLIWLQGHMLIRTSQSLMKGMRSDISAKLNRIPLSRFDSSSFGDVLSRVTNDVDTVGNSLNDSVIDIVTALFTFAGCTIMMLLNNWILTLVAVSTACLGLLSMTNIIKKSQKHFSARQRYLGEINGHIEEMYAGHMIVQANNGQDASIKEFRRINELLYDSAWKSQVMSGFMKPINEFLGNISYVAICIIGAIMAKSGMIRFGTIVAFILYGKMFSQPLTMSAQALTNIQSAAAASERIFAFLEESEMEDETDKTAKIENANCKGIVEFKNVNFGYSKDKTIINNFSAKINPGQKIAIVGPTGAGKTTLVNLLMRFYEINSGKITIDGIDIRDITRENVHKLICMVLQDTWLFEGTIRDNIKYSNKDASEEDIINACKAVGLHHFISSLPLGYDTILTDDSNLSAGQRQLMTIARAMVNNAPLLVLDEATSSVDTRTEQMVQDAMDKLTQGRTSFTIAHRLSTIRNADLILVMKDGDIVETGNHKELLEKGGFYSDLWTSQFVNAEVI